MKRTKALVAGLASTFILACTTDDQRTVVVLADTAVQLGVDPTLFRPEAPLPSADDVNGVCVTPPAGDTLNDNWTLPGVNREAVKLRAEAVLMDQSVVELPSTAWMGELCLEPARQGPLAGGVREVRIWASGPIVARRITWISTHK